MMKMFKIDIVKEKIDGVDYDGRKNLNSSQLAYDVLKDIYSQWSDDKERVLAIPLDSKNKPLGVDLVSIGTVNTALMHPREVFRKAIIAGANSVIVSHNHPSGDPSPSREDIDMTERLKSAGTILGIRLLDHIIIGDQAFVSLAELNII